MQEMQVQPLGQKHALVKGMAKKLMLLSCGVGKTLESPLDCKEIKSVKGNQS